MNLFKQWIGRWLLENLKRKSARQKVEFSSLKAVKSMAILMELKAGDSLKPEALEKELSALKIPYRILVIADRGLAPAIDLEKWTFFSLNKSDVRSRPKEESATDFLNQSFDLMLDLTTSNDLTVLLTAYRIKARFKAGLSTKLRQPYLNFMISGGETANGPIGLLKELLGYLQQIKRGYEG